MPKVRVESRFILSVLFFLAISLVLFGAALNPDVIFSASDANMGWLTFKKGAMPEMFSGAYRAFPLLGASFLKQPILSDVLLWLLPVPIYNDAIYAVFLLGASIFLLLFLRLLSRSWVGACCGVLIALWLGSITVTSSGHIGKFGVAFFGCAALYFIEKTVRASSRVRVLWALIAGGSIGGMLLEQQDVGLFWGIFIGAYALFRSIQQYGKSDWLGYAGVFLPIAVAALLLTGPSALVMYKTNVTDIASVENTNSQSAEKKWNYITQWSFAPTETLDIVAPGLMGWKTGDPEGPYWGSIGQSAEWTQTGQGFKNFKLDSVYIGILPVLLALFAIFRSRSSREYRTTIWFLCGASIVLFLLAYGKFTPLYRLFYALPIVNNIRAPVKFLQIFQLTVGVLAAFGLDELFNNSDQLKKSLKRVLIVFGAISCGFFLSALFTTFGRQSWIEYFNSEGWGASKVIVDNIVRALTHAGIMAGLGGGMVWLSVRSSIKKLVPFMLIALILADIWILTRPYLKDEPIAAYDSPDAVLDFLSSNIDNDRIYLFDASGMHNRWVGVDFRYRKINCFNIFQMPRMQTDYKHWLQTIRNPLRQMQLSSVKYASIPLQAWQNVENQPELIKSFQPVFFYGFSQPAPGVIVSVRVDRARASHVLVEYLDGFSRISTKFQWQEVADDVVCNSLMSPTFDPRTTVLIAPQPDGELPVSSGTGHGKVSRVSVRQNQTAATVELDHPGIVLFTQKYDRGWKVYVDGEEQTLLRCNYLCMGVHVEGGSHEIGFRYDPSSYGLWIQAAGLLLVLAAAIGLFTPSMNRGTGNGLQRKGAE